MEDPYLTNLLTVNSTLQMRVLTRELLCYSDPNKPMKIDESMWSAWEPMKTKRIEYLRIRINGKMETDLYEGKYKFWERLPLLSKYFKYF